MISAHATHVDWGSVPAWVGSILTGGSLLLGFYIWLRAKRREESAQARRLIYWFDPPPVTEPFAPAPKPYPVTLHVHNTSDSYFFNVELHAVVHTHFRRPWLANCFTRPARPVVYAQVSTRQLIGNFSYEELFRPEPLIPGEERTLNLLVPVPPKSYRLRTWLTFIDAAGTQWRVKSSRRRNLVAMNRRLRLLLYGTANIIQAFFLALGIIYEIAHQLPKAYKEVRKRRQLVESKTPPSADQNK